MTDAKLLRAAIDKSGLPAVRFATDVLGLRETQLGTFWRWRAGTRTLDAVPTVRLVCRAIVKAPKLARVLAAVSGATVR